MELLTLAGINVTVAVAFAAFLRARTRLSRNGSRLSAGTPPR